MILFISVTSDQNSDNYNSHLFLILEQQLLTIISALYHYCFAFSALTRLSGRKGIRSVTNWVVGCWRGYVSGWVKVQICMWPSWCYCHLLSIAWRSQGWEPFRDREESSTSSLLPELQFSIHSITGSYARTAATSAYIGLTVHRARSNAYHRNQTGRWPSR